jgi:hypothetical protein
MPTTARKSTAPKPGPQTAPTVVKERMPLSALLVGMESLDDYEPAPEQLRENAVRNAIAALLEAGKTAARVKVPTEERARIISAWQTQANLLDRTARPYDEASEDDGKTAVIVFRLVDKITRTRSEA